jgi:2-oxoacid:acceptor oxidoreductase gamma subunit (pyruvate/2-ketoisovalerate family)
MAFVRVDNKEIGIRSNVYQPDHVVVLDVSLTKTMDVTGGLKKNGWILVNSSKPPEDFTFSEVYTTATVDANNIAIKYHLGTPTSPIVNTAILGAFSKLTGLVSIDAVLAAIKEAVPENAETNGSAAIEAYRRVKFKGKA